MADAIRVLLVDDESSFAEMAAGSLERADERFEIELETDAEAGLDRATEAEVDCIISDHDLPGMDGIDFLEAVREVEPELPFVLFTGKGSEEIASEAISAGVTDYLQKEVGTDQFEVLANRVNNAVEASRTERELKEHERELERYETFVETIAGGVFAQDAEGRYSFVNSYIEEKTGYDREEIIGETPSMFLEASELEMFEDGILAMLEGSTESVTAETEIVRADGDTVPVEVRVTLLPTDDGFRGIIGVVQDISDRKQRQRALEQYETIVEAVGDAAYRLDEAGHFTFVSEALEALSGYDADELLGEHVSKVMTESDIEVGESIIRDLLGSNERTRGAFELALRTANGNQIPCEDHMALLQSEGEFAGTAGVLRDITERKERERELERHRETLEQLHETTSQLYAADSIDACLDVTIDTAISILGFDWCIIAAADDDEQLFEVRAISGDAPLAVGDRPFAVDEGIAGQVYQSGVSSVVDDVHAVDEGEPVTDAITSGLSVPIGDWGVFQAASTKADGFEEADRRQAKLLASSLFSAIERIEHRVELERRQDALERQNEQLEEFASIVSHDLRNPLNVADGRVELARDECNSEHLEAATEALERMDRLIADVLRLARNGEQVQEMVEVSVPKVCERSWETVDTADASLELGTERRIQADRSRFQQLLENLFRNAVEHGGDDVTVTVRDRPDGFAIADDGPGIPESERTDVFERGYSTSGDGIGFGLRIVDGIVDAHDWEVTVSESDSGGTRLDVTGVTVVETEG
jgi:PAS domain S-box-containing protein